MSLSTLLSRRIDRTTFTGLPLLLFSAFFLLLLFVFIDIVEDIVTSNEIVSLDIAFATLLAGMRTPSLTQAFLFITELGSTTSIFFISAATALSYAFFSKGRHLVPFLLSALGTTASISILKMLIARDRPDTLIAFYSEKLYSFPSGHSASTAAIFGFIAYIWIRTTHSLLLRWGITIATILLVGGIGFSRLYLGVHYASDVVGGSILGALWLIIGICTTELLRKKN